MGLNAHSYIPPKVEVNVQDEHNIGYKFKGEFLASPDIEFNFFSVFHDHPTINQPSINIYYLLKFFIKNGDGFDSLMIFADWLEDNGYNEAADKFKKQFGVHI